MKFKISKKVFIPIIIILVILGIGRILKVKGYIPKHPVYASLVKMGIIKYCYSASDDMIEILKQEGFDYEKQDESIVLSSLNKISNLDIELLSSPKIPLITHKVYFTSTTSPIDLNDFYLEELKINYNRLNAIDDNWQHNIWTNRVDIIPDEIKNIKGVKVRIPQDLHHHPSYNNLMIILEKGNTKRPYFAEAADLVRLMALQEFGGIYSDLDYEIYDANALFKLLHKFDFIAGREVPLRYSYYGNAFIAAKANHPVINEAATRSLKQYVVNREDPQTLTYLKYPCNQYDKLYFSGPPLLTISYFKKNNIEGNNDVILPPWMIFNLNFARFKNKPSSEESEQECQYSKISKEHFVNITNNINQLLAEYKNNIKMEDLYKYYDFKKHDVKGFKYKDSEDNIYYNLEDKDKFPIIGADMFCGSWTFGGKIFKKQYYWSWQYSDEK